MLNNVLSNKVKVFISSKCNNDKYIITRTALKEILINTGLVDVYIFEDAPGSSFPIEESYLQELDNSDLCIFLIDNAEEITEGVLKEYVRANKLNKKTIYFFCDQNKKDKTKIQEEIEKIGNQRYKTVHEFSEIIREGYKAVLQDIVNMYKFKNHLPLESNKEIKIEEIEENVKTKEYKIKKIDKNGLKLTTNELLNELTIGRIDKPDETNEFDTQCADFLKVVLKNKKIDNDNFEKMKQRILSMYTGNLKNVIEKRLNAIKYYYNGQLEMCIKELKSIFDFKYKNIPEWIMNDIAVDLRNIETMNDETKNILRRNNFGQEYIDNSEESLYYPMIDRIESDRKKELLKKLTDMKLNSPYTSKIENFQYIFEYISLCYYIALVNGSITHLRITLGRIYDTLLTLNFKFNNSDMYIQIIKILIISQRDKEIEKILRTYKNNVDVISSNDIRVIYNMIENIEIPYYQEISICLLLKYFKYYFSDEDYKNIFEKTCKNIEKWIDDKNGIVVLRKVLF